MTFIAGPFTATYTPPSGAALALGITQDGFDLQWMMHGDPIRGDNLGESIQDGVWRGHDCYMEFLCEEFDSAALYGAHTAAASAMWPGSTHFGRHGQVGRLFTALAGSLILTPVAGTGALPAGSLTCGKALLANGHVVRSKMATRLRTVPLRFLLLPYTVSSNVVHFVNA